jgi:Ca2+-binding RTX toxin-like protein
LGWLEKSVSLLEEHMFIHDRVPRFPRALIPALTGAAMFGALPLLLAQPAQAATAGCYGDCHPGVVRSAGILKYDTLAGQNDQVTVSVIGGVLTVTNPASTLTAGAGCTLVTAHQASCEAAAKVFAISLRSLDGDDSITNATAISSLIRAGDGNDRLVGGSGADTLVGGFGGDLIQGGTGSDTAGYSEVSDRLGVQADLDGATGDDGSSQDGPTGARDTIASDVENLEGTNADDILIGNAGPNVIDGSGGHDRVQGLGGDDALTADGGGTIDGGAGADQCTSDTRLVPTAADSFVNCERTAVLTP